MQKSHKENIIISDNKAKDQKNKISELERNLDIKTRGLERAENELLELEKNFK